MTQYHVIGVMCFLLFYQKALLRKNNMILGCILAKAWYLGWHHARYFHDRKKMCVICKQRSC